MGDFALMNENTIIEEKAENSANTEELEVLENEIIEDGEAIYQETVSMGDYLPFAYSDTLSQTLTVEDITVAVEDAVLHTELIATENNGLFEKPLEDYTVTESLLLILVLCAVGLVIDKIIGGVLNCTRLLRK